MVHTKTRDDKRDVSRLRDPPASALIGSGAVKVAASLDATDAIAATMSNSCVVDMLLKLAASEKITFYRAVVGLGLAIITLLSLLTTTRSFPDNRDDPAALLPKPTQ